jgi:hypothetical protein
MCPLLTPQGKTSLKQLFSGDSMKKAGVKMDAAYLSCTKDAGPDHKGFFTMEANSPDAIKKYFGAMAVDVRPVQTLADVSKML